MGGSTFRALVLVGAFFILCPFDTKIITTGLGVPHMDVGHVAILEQMPDLGLDDAVRNIALRNQPPAPRVRVESETVGKHILRKAPVFRISFALLLMDENGTRQGKILLSME
jgi:hypothetical protein